MTTRTEHLDWAKGRALQLVAARDLPGAVASMLSDITKWSEPLYTPDVIALVSAEGMLFCRTADQVRHWIEGFG
jgi:hypothetical protein